MQSLYSQGDSGDEPDGSQSPKRRKRLPEGAHNPPADVMV